LKRVIIDKTLVASILGELKHALDLSKPKLVFCSPYAAKTALKVCKSLKYVQNVILIGGKKLDKFAISLGDFEKLAEKSQFNVEDNVAHKVDIKDQVSLIVCSSGTTGLPKGVMITQENMMSVIQGYRDLFIITKMIYGDTLCILNIAPWFHALGFMSMFMIACSRDSIYVFLPKFEEKAFLGSIEASFRFRIHFVIHNFSLSIEIQSQHDHSRSASYGFASKESAV
jgi:4-coumarate--CoA ligase